MDFKEAYIDKMICHRFSLDKHKCLINHIDMDMAKLDQAFLKDFFIKPFNREKVQYSFVHSVDLKYNIVYNYNLYNLWRQYEKKKSISKRG